MVLGTDETGMYLAWDEEQKVMGGGITQVCASVLSDHLFVT